MEGREWGLGPDDGFCRLSSSLIEGIRAGYLQWPSKIMVAGSYESVTYADAYYRSLALARIMRERWGIDSDSTVLFSAHNVCWYPVVVAAVQMCGARLVLVTGAAEAQDFKGAIGLMRPDLAVVSCLEHDEIFEEMAPCIARASLTYVSRQAPCLEDMVARAMNEGRFMEGAPPSDSEIVLFSSGSTGAPKAIVNRSSSFRRSGLAQAEVLRATADDVCYIPVPFSHTYGVVSLYTAIEHGCTVATNTKYRPDVSLATVSSLRATLYFGVPTMYLRELAANDEGSWDVSCLRAGLVAGSSCPKSVFADYEDRYGCVLVQCYGMTETAATLTAGSLDEPCSARACTVGRPIPGARIALSPETKEIICSTPSMMSGIVRSDGTLDPSVDECGWFHTGDVGSIDAEGRLVITGRIKDMIIRGGINIFPAEVENAYQDCSAVAASCVVGYPDPELGERTCLCVVPAANAEMSSCELRSFAKGKLEKCKIPDVVLKMEDLPRLGNGKIDKKALREWALATLEQSSIQKKRSERREGHDHGDSKQGGAFPPVR